MFTFGQLTRAKASEKFPFLAKKYRGRRKAIKAFTHLAPDFVFWIYPDGTLHDAKDAHIKHVPKGYDYILKDEPEYGGFLRGRVASNFGPALIVVYCRADALINDQSRIIQFIDGLSQIPIPISPDTLVVSDNGDIYGNVEEVEDRINGM